MELTTLTGKFIRLLERHYQLLLLVTGAAWLLMVNSLMIADVWDETNALLILQSEPVEALGPVEAAVLVWLQQLPLDVYRPLGSSLFLLIGKLSGGSYILLRFVNAAFILGAAGLFAAALIRLGSGITRGVIFFVFMLFSASAMITAGWFANIFDATCLFFIALATWAYVRRQTGLVCIALALAVFSKEVYVLALPFLGLLALQDSQRNVRSLLIMSLALGGFSLLYWSARQAMIPLGSAADVHTFVFADLTSSAASYLAGLVFQFSKFSLYSSMFWLGLTILLVTLFGIRDNASKLAVVLLLLMSGGIYWGMFGFQENNVMTFHNFVGRLYLVPFALLLFISCKDATWPALGLVVVASSFGLLLTYRDYAVFQATYLEVYSLAERSDETLFVHYPEKPLNDYRRDLQIGDFPLAPWRINVASGGLERRPPQ